MSTGSRHMTAGIAGVDFGPPLPVFAAVDPAKYPRTRMAVHDPALAIRRIDEPPCECTTQPPSELFQILGSYRPSERNFVEPGSVSSTCGRFFQPNVIPVTFTAISQEIPPNENL